jgi:hypothetical protein
MEAASVIAWKPLGELLVERGLLTVTELDDALEEQERTGELLGAILVARRIIAGAVLTTILAEQVGAELEVQGGFGSGLFAKIARRSGTTSPKSVLPVVEEAPADSLHSPAAPFNDPAFEITALRAELDLERTRRMQLEGELEALRAKPAPKRRAKPKPRAKSKPQAA